MTTTGTGLKITGKDTCKKGKTLALKAELTPKKPAVKTVEWSLDVDGSIVIEPKGFHYIPVEKRNAMLEEMFVIVELTPENIDQYCDFAIITVAEKDSFGELTGDTNTRVL